MLTPGNRRLKIPGPWQAILALAVFPAGSATPAAEPPWRVLETPRFTLVSQISERQTREWGEEFAQFIKALGALYKINDRLLVPLTIVIFDREREYAPYRLVSPDGQSKEWVFGQFVSRDTWSVIGMINQWNEEWVRRAIYMKGAYWILSAGCSRQPPWLRIGSAEVFSTFSVDKWSVKWGDVIQPYVHFLKSHRLLPMEKFLFTTARQRESFSKEETQLYYAQSWLFMHYLLFGQNTDDQGRLFDFMTAINGGTPLAEAMQNSFGSDYVAMEKGLQRYLILGRFRMLSQPRIQSEKATLSVHPASPAMVQTSLGKLALGARRNDLARRHAEEALRLDPGYWPGQLLAAWVHFEFADYDAALEASQKALEGGAANADAFYLRAIAKEKKAQALGGSSAKEARLMANLYEKAINHSPNLKAAYHHLINILRQLDETNEHDEQFIEQGIRMFPEEDGWQVGRAMLLRKKGKKEEASQILEDLCADRAGMSPARWESYTCLQQLWDVQDTGDQAKALLQQNQPKQALTLLDDLLLRHPSFPARPEIEQMRRGVVAAAVLEDARAAEASARTDEAAGLFQSVADMEGAPVQLRDLARHALQKLRDSGPGKSSPDSPADSTPEN